MVFIEDGGGATMMGKVATTAVAWDPVTGVGAWFGACGGQRATTRAR